MKKIKYVLGEIVGPYGIKYLKEENCYVEPSGRKRRAALFLCHCGKTYIARINDVRKGKSSSCNCKKGSGPNAYKEGDIINGIKFIRTLGQVKYAQRAIFKCPICGRDWESFVANIQQGNSKACCTIRRGWTRNQWTSRFKTVILYKVLLYNNNEEFIKIGITHKNVEKRIKVIPYNFKIMKVIEGNSLYIFNLENRIKRFFKKSRYTPLIHFKGKTECFKLNN